MPHDETKGFRPHDVTMPQLGMAQDAGRIVSWLKAPGDAVSRGDALFEVETDKAVMEIEAPADGFLTGVAYGAGDDVPVGQIIARISHSPDETGPDSAGGAPAPDTAETTPAQTPAADAALPEGHEITMPQLGMAQDSGLLVAWLKAPGDALVADDILFEVETDKSTMEVAAGRDGWLAATLAEAGEAVPVGAAVAIISDAKPDAPMARSAKATAAPSAQRATAPAPAKTAPAPARPAPSPAASAPPRQGRILASPKARRLALEQGLDLHRLAETGHPQPFRVADLDVLRALPDAASTALASVAAPVSRRLTAQCAADGLAGFIAWAREAQAVTDGDAVLAGLAGASLNLPDVAVIAVERHGQSRRFAVPPTRRLSDVAQTDADPSLILRDLRGTRLASLSMGAEALPVLTVASEGAGLSITLEAAAEWGDAQAAIALITEFAGRVDQPLRHLL